MADQLRALIVSYSFPPVGGAGVQRVVKLTKYLPGYGIRPTVLTVSNPSVPVLDSSLEKDLPSDVQVMRVRTFEPGYAMKKAAWSASSSKANNGANTEPSVTQQFVRRLSGVAKQLLVPDPQVLWQPSAQRALVSRMVGRCDDLIFISGPPFSQFLLAPMARLQPGMAVVLDYRDEWSTYRTTYEMMGSKFGAAFGDAAEPTILRLAHAITTATAEFRENLLTRFPFLNPSRVFAIPNGYDSADFPSDLPGPSGDKFVITYAGTIFKLTSARGFLGAVRKLHEREPELARKLEIRFVGRIVDTEQDSFVGTEELGVRQMGYIPHDSVMRELSASDLVLCLLDDVPAVERIYPAKIFELMKLGRPILTLSPPGALANLVERHHLGDLLAPRDEERIAAYLADKLRTFDATSKTRNAAVSAVGIDRYDRKRLAGEFAHVFSEAVRFAKAGEAA